VFAVVLGELLTGVYTPRYVLPAILGISVLVSLAVYRLDRSGPVVGVLLIGLLAVLWIGRIALSYRVTSDGARHQRAVLRYLAAESRSGLPLVIASPLDDLELTYEAARSGGLRFIYLADRSAALTRLGADSAEFGMLELARISPVKVRDYETFLASHRRFLAYQGSGRASWLEDQLRADHRRLTVIKRDERGVVFEVRRGV